MPPLPPNLEAWAALYKNYGAQAVESDIFESGSNFKYESALRLRVLHKVKDVVVYHNETRWIKSSDIFPPKLQIEAKEAIRGPHFAGLLDVVRRPASDRPRGEWSADDFIQAGYFGPFLSLLSLIEHDKTTGEEIGGSAVTYFDHTPLAKRTRFQLRPKLDLNTPPPKIKYTYDDVFEEQGLPPQTPEPPEEPPSGKGSVAKYERAKVDVRDEQTVNQCLINLMLPIAWPLDISGNLDPERRAMKFFLEGKIGYQARVDGIITKKNCSTDVVGFLEAKRGRRTHGVRLQEAAEMVASIATQSAEDDSEDWVEKRRWLVSMCANEMFITIATCERPYLDFLATMPKWNGDESELKGDAFLHMTEHGPYKLRYHSHLVAALEHLYVLLSQT